MEMRWGVLKTVAVRSSVDRRDLHKVLGCLHEKGCRCNLLKMCWPLPLSPISPSGGQVGERNPKSIFSSTSWQFPKTRGPVMYTYPETPRCFLFWVVYCNSLAENTTKRKETTLEPSGKDSINPFALHHQKETTEFLKTPV